MFAECSRIKVCWMILLIGYACPNPYKLIMPAVSWGVAKTQCEHNGMDLVVINDNNIMTEVRTYIDGFSADIWIGLKWSGIYREFFWVNNSKLSWPVGDPPWYSGEPNCMGVGIPCDHGNFIEKCVRMIDNSLKWRTHGCDHPHLAICQSLSSATRYVSTTSKSVNTNHPTTVNSTTIDSPTTTESVTINLSTTIKSAATSSPTTSKSTVAETSPESTKAQSQTQLTTESVTTKLSTNTKPTSTIESTELPLIVTTELITLNMEPSFNTSTEYTTYGTFFNNCTQICTCKSLAKEINSPKENYRIDKRQTSAYIRRHSSAFDSRLSSRIIGYTGAAVICAAVLIVVSFDIINLVKRNAATK